MAYQANGQVKEAIELLEHVVAIKEKVLKDDHPSRLVSQNALLTANLYSFDIRSSNERRAKQARKYPALHHVFSNGLISPFSCIGAINEHTR